jgi:class 3 adenylate cyclase
MEGVVRSVKEAARYWLVLLVAILGAITAFYFSSFGRLKSLDSDIDSQLQMEFSPIPESTDVVIVQVSRDDLRSSTGLLGAVPRHLHAELIDGLKRVGAKVALFDLQFDSRPQPKEDPPLREAILNSAPLGITLCMTPVVQKNDDSALNGELDWFAPPAFLPKNLPPNVQVGQSSSVYTGANSVGVQLECINQNTGKFVDNIALVGYRELHHIPASDVHVDLKNHLVTFGRREVQIGADADLRILWPSNESNPPTKKYWEALEILRKGDPDHFFRGKLVVVGNPLGDPVLQTENGEKSGLQMVAAAVNTLIHSKVMRLNNQVAEGWTGLVALAMAIGASLRKRRRAIAVAIYVGLLTVLGPILAARLGLGLLQASPAIMACAIVGVVGFLAKAVVPNWYPMPATGQIEATVLVVDIKDSTPLFEALGAKRGSELISGALDVAARSVIANRGEVIQTTGDGFIALFRSGAPEDHAGDGVAAARMIVERPSTESGVNFRAGLETGILDQGRRGLQGLPFHYATRLEALCATESQKLLIGPAAAAYSSKRFRMESIGARKLKGIRTPIEPSRLIHE